MAPCSRVRECILEHPCAARKCTTTQQCSSGDSEWTHSFEIDKQAGLLQHAAGLAGCVCRSIAAYPPPCHQGHCTRALTLGQSRLLVHAASWRMTHAEQTDLHLLTGLLALNSSTPEAARWHRPLAGLAFLTHVFS